MDKNIGSIYDCYKIVGVKNEKTKCGHNIYIGECIYCGCLREGMLSDLKKIKICRHKPMKTVKSSKQWHSDRLRKAFTKMYIRCYDNTNKDYRFYGAKGIKICDEWLSDANNFQEWALNNGYNDELTIDRIDSSKDYSPENCRWITKSENSRFKSNTNIIEVDGIVHSGLEWSKIIGKGRNFVNRYLKTNGLEETKKFIKKCLTK